MSHETHHRAVALVLATCVGLALARALPSPRAASTAPTEPRAARPRSEHRTDPLDPNTATLTELESLPGVGPRLARAIATARDAGVVFRRAEDLEAVRGFGAVAVRRLRPLLRFARRDAPDAPARDATDPP